MIRRISPHVALAVALLVTLVVAPAVGMWWES